MVVAAGTLVIPASLFPVLWFWNMLHAAIYLGRSDALNSHTHCVDLLRDLNPHMNWTRTPSGTHYSVSDVMRMAHKHLHKTFGSMSLEARRTLLANALMMLEDLKNPDRINMGTNTT